MTRSSLHNSRWRAVLPPLAAWVGCVLLFAGVYTIAWGVNPDSFLLNKELNLSPLDAMWSASRTGLDNDTRELVLPGTDPGGADDLAAISSPARKLIDEVHATGIRIAALKADLFLKEAFRARLAKDINASLKTGFDAYREIHTRQAQRALAEAKHLSVLAASRSSSDGARDIAVANANVAVAQAEANLADALRDANDYIVEHPGEFVPPALRDKLKDSDEAIITTLKELSAQQQALVQGNDKIREEASRIESLRSSRLNFIDFLYFSASIACSNSLGDITPNLRGIRAVVLSELLACIVIVAWLLTRLFEKPEPEAGVVPDEPRG